MWTTRHSLPGRVASRVPTTLLQSGFVLAKAAASAIATSLSEAKRATLAREFEPRG